MPIIFVMHDEIFKQHLEELIERFQTLGGALEEIAHVVTEYITRNFEDAPWPPLAMATIELKERYGYPFYPLVRSGNMKEMATGGDWKITGGGSRWKASLPVPGYSNFHFTGTRFMPRRDYALLADSIESEIADILEGYLFAGMVG